MRTYIFTLNFGIIFLIGRLIVLPFVTAFGQTPALMTVDLASDSKWSLTIDDNASSRSICVPCGGYNSDLQEKPWIDAYLDVKDHVNYTRLITIPMAARNQGTVLNFGAVNHGAKIYLLDGISEVFAGGHDGPLMPFSINITKLIIPGATYTLRVIAYHYKHYGNGMPTGFVYDEVWSKRNPRPGWNARFAYGIAKSVELVIYPQTYIVDIFVKPSVSSLSLSFSTSIIHHGSAPIQLHLVSSLSAWKSSEFVQFNWSYPIIRDVWINMTAESTVTIDIGPIDWSQPGSDNFWWPNKPFNEGYIPKLNILNLTINGPNVRSSSRAIRFGFVEYTEGNYFYLVNGVRLNIISDATPEAAMSEYDCYSVSPAFLPPSISRTGCPESWKRYMRMGISANRIHQSTPTEYMMNAADEVGFLLIPETPIRGGNTWNDTFMLASVRELAAVCRNHPSVMRYSVMNESPPIWVKKLVDAIATVDNTRPFVFNDNKQRHPGKITGLSNKSHAYCMMHYQPVPHNVTMITGMGESAWCVPDGMEEFSKQVIDGRRHDVCYYSGWDWINYWPNFLEGMNAKKHAWKQERCSRDDRSDGIDGWNSSIVDWVQKAFHPFLLIDVEIYLDNPSYTANWPTHTITVGAGSVICRSIELFNDGLNVEKLIFNWSLRWDTPTGDIITEESVKNIQIEPGFHLATNFSFHAPSLNPKQLNKKRHLYVVMESRRGEKVLFLEDRVHMMVSNEAIINVSYSINTSRTFGDPSQGGAILHGNSTEVKYVGDFDTVTNCQQACLSLVDTDDMQCWAYTWVGSDFDLKDWRKGCYVRIDNKGKLVQQSNVYSGFVTNLCSNSKQEIFQNTLFDNVQNGHV